ncbi:MAG: hypothetical protein FVQ83_08295 [Chloroflexi bacterium]|nr:hypothetical protein [Chloroflexota bacterium]
MTPQIPPRDIKNLSAYLDEQLPERERKRLEARLAEDAILRRVLENLRQTRNALRSVPQVRAPRNFTLTPEMAGKRNFRPRLFTSMQLVSAMASFLFFMVFFGDMIFNVILPGSLPASQPEVITIAEADGESEAEGETVEMDLAAEDSAEESSRIGESVPAEAPAPLAAAEAEFTDTDAPETEELQTESQAEAGADDTTSQAPEAGQAPPGVISTPTIMLESEPDESLALSTPIYQTTPSITAEPELEATPTISITEAEPPASGKEIPWLRIIEGVLAFMAVGSGVSAFIFRRLSRAL